MSQCELNPEPGKPFESFGFWLVMLFVMLDLGLTIPGVLLGAGTEQNPFFVWFTEQGLEWMIVGFVIYLIVIYLFFSFTSGWVQAIGAGFLTAIHVVGMLSWIRLFTPHFAFVFDDIFVLIVTPALLASAVTILTYVNIRTCPGPVQRGGLDAGEVRIRD